MDVAYLVGGVFAAPLLLRKRLRTGKYRTGLAARFGWGEEELPPPRLGGGDGKNARTLLLHCVSVGELNSVQTLIGRLLAADPQLRIVVTTGTDTGTERAQKLYRSPASTGSSPRRVFLVRFPFDFSFAVERLLDRVQPDAIALVELETWPNFLEIAAERRIPVAIINGRISDRSFPRYRLIRPLMAAMLRYVTWIGAQTDTIGERFRRLGAAHVEVIPTLKYDNAHLADHVPGQEALAAAMGLLAEQRLLVAGSTGPGEEEAVLACYAALREKHPELRLAIVPRHPEVVPQVVAAIEKAGLEPVLRSNRPDSPSIENGKSKLENHQVFVLNTMGELRKLYALAFAVFVGRSLVKKGGGGSDMIEVAALGKPCCFGPYTSNFAEVVELLTGGGVAKEVADAGELADVVGEWLGDPQHALEVGRQAQELIRQQQAARATERYVARLLELVAGTIPALPLESDLRII